MRQQKVGLRCEASLWGDFRECKTLACPTSVSSRRYGPERELPCPGCTHLLDGIDGAARHIGARAALHIVAKSPIARLAAWADERGWKHLSLLSTAGNNYDADYFGDTSKFPKGMRQQHRVPNDENWEETIFNVFRKNDGKISHFWGSEMSFAPPAPKQHHRAGDLIDPLSGTSST